jgi:hypothetical protein
MDSFADLVKKHFQFLIDDYGFSLGSEDHFLVQYRTSECRVHIGLDRCQVLVELRPERASICQDAWVGLGEVVLYKDPSVRFRNAPHPTEYNRDPVAYLNKQLPRLARWLRQYCEEMLRGDFSRRETLEKLRAEKYQRWCAEMARRAARRS